MGFAMDRRTNKRILRNAKIIFFVSITPQDGRVYMVDYKILEGIPAFGEDDPDAERRYTSASMGLFYVRNNGDLVPIAIQLHQEPSDTNPIWTPKDSEYDWLYAKMWLRNAHAQCHQVRESASFQGVGDLESP